VSKVSSVIGDNIKVSLFGESHGSVVGATIHGLESGIKIDYEFIKHQMNLRKANDNLSTARVEEDEVKFISGVFNDFTTGAPLTVVIENKNVNSKDYPKMFRPSHADYTQELKYKGYQDYRGGGHFSGRLTAPIVALGSIAISILKNKNIKIGSHIKNIHNILDDNINFNELDNYFNYVNNEIFPVLNLNKKEEMIKEIKTIKEDLDSVGGIIETVISLPSSIGEPFFDSLESKISQYLFSVPGLKGIEFGLGFDFAKYRGKEVNDELVNDGEVRTLTNNNGGINGGISNSMPIVFRCVLKPTPSILKEQRSIDENFNNTILEIKGRHDPCIVRRARVVIDSLVALCLLDLISINEGKKWMC
jgi:chorismate synthase